MMQARLARGALAGAFAVLAGMLVAMDQLVGSQAVVWIAAVALALLPSGWFGPARGSGRLAELLVLPAALCMAMTPDATMRWMLVPPLVGLLALATTAVALGGSSSTRAAFLVGALALSLRLAPGVGAQGGIGFAISCALSVAAAAAVTVLLGANSGLMLALVTPALPWFGPPAAVIAAVVARNLDGGAIDRVARAWRPHALLVCLVSLTLAPWGLPPLSVLVGRPAPSGILAWAASLAIAPFAPAFVSGALLLTGTMLLGPVQLPPPDLPGAHLDATHSTVSLATTTTAPFVLDLALTNAASLPAGTPVATLVAGSTSFRLLVGVHAVEWAALRSDVRPTLAHPLPPTTILRPAAPGLYGVAGRSVFHLSADLPPTLLRDPGLPAAVNVEVGAAGPARASPPRDWSALAWALAAAVVVAAVQLLAGRHRDLASGVPWVFLSLLAFSAVAPVEPLHLLGERFAVDLALAAVLLAWVPWAARALAAGRALVAAVMLLVPLAIATPHLTPPLWGDEPYHLAMMESLARHHSFDVNRYFPPGRPDSPVHTPVLAVLLLPGYLIAGRVGCLVELALAGSLAVALLLRRARSLLPGSDQRQAWLGLLLLLTFPLATFVTQVWVEMVGVLVAAVLLDWLARGRAPRLGAALLAAIAVAVKVRLALIAVPLAALAWRPARMERRRVLAAAAGVGAFIVAGLAVPWLVYGRPLGSRTLADMVPHHLLQPPLVILGLIFDPAGGLLFAAPLLVAGLAGLPGLWRRGGAGERALILGGAATVAALLHSTEWYGGGSPPARYLVPLLPAFALSLAVLLREPRGGRRALAVLAVPAGAAWWMLITRPQVSINPGDGGSWLADPLAVRFAADARRLFPSFLRPGPATVIVPLLLITIVGVLAVVCRRSRTFERALSRLSPVVWLLVGTGVVLAVATHRDHVVELEDPQVVKLGGSPEPAEGTFSRFSYRNGWRLGDGQGVEVPVRLGRIGAPRLYGWLEGRAVTGATLVTSWDGAPAGRIPVAGAARDGSLPLPISPGAGRHRLRLVLEAPAGGTAVLDRLVLR
jgi:hypothetical protein